MSYTIVCALLGGLFGWVGDGGHVSAGVLDYPKKDHFWWPGLAWWVVPQFAMGGVALSFLVRMALARKLRAEPSYALPSQTPSYALGGACFLAALGTYLLSSLLTVQGWSESAVSLTLLACTLLVGYFACMRWLGLGPMLALALPVGLGGVAYESALSSTGVFRYIHPDQGLWVNHWIAWLWIGAVWSAIGPMWRYEYGQQQQAAASAQKSTGRKRK